MRVKRLVVRGLVVLAAVFLGLVSLAAAVYPVTSPAAIPVAPVSPALAGAVATSPDGEVQVLIYTRGAESDALAVTVAELGGEVRYTYESVEGMAATVPAGAVPALVRHADVARIELDVTRHLQVSQSELPAQRGAGSEALDFEMMYRPYVYDDFISARTLTDAEVEAFAPAVYNLGLTGAMGVTPEVWQATDFGAGSTIAIIDTGIYSKHFMFRDDRVVGGINLHPTDDVDWDNPANHWHGSHVAGIAAGSGAVRLHEDDLLVRTIEEWTETELPSEDNGETKILPLLGVAPKASLYIVKVFPTTGAGVSESVIINAIDHVIEVREEFGIDAISMSLGGATLFDGRDLEDRTVDAATDAGIAVVSAAGNDGPAFMTVSSPGSAHKGIAVAAAADPVNVRVFWDVFAGQVGIGDELFTSDVPTIIGFSSRGPTADGRTKPTLAASGVFILSAWTTPVPGAQGIAFASGTSMATPHVSGAVALLNTFEELHNLGATPFDFKQALTAEATVLDGWALRDQGAGLLDVEGAVADLAVQGTGDEELALSADASLVDIATGQIEVPTDLTATATVTLEPGRYTQMVFALDSSVRTVKLTISDVDLGDSAPTVGPELFGWDDPPRSQPSINSLEVFAHGAKRGGTFFDYLFDSTNVWGEASFVMTHFHSEWEGALWNDVTPREDLLEPGFFKVVIENDWTSFSAIEFTFDVAVTTWTFPPVNHDIEELGPIGHEELHCYGIESNPLSFPPKAECDGTDPATSLVGSDLPEDASTVGFFLSWENDYTRYPTSDLDLVVIQFETIGQMVQIKAVYFAGSSLDSPEAFLIDANNVAETDTFAFLVYGFSVEEVVAPEPYDLQVFFDFPTDV